MSYHEALEDEIRIKKAGCQTIYYPGCQFCGYEVRSLSYLRNRQYTCNDCRKHKSILLKTGLFNSQKNESKCD